MKRILTILSFFIAVTAFSQSRKSPHDTISSKNITLTYGRPSLHGRVIFGELVKYGQVWRLGADEATTISFTNDTKFGGVSVPAGTFTLFALVNENEWTFIFNSVPGQWGAFAYEKNKEKDLVHVTVPVNRSETPVEQLTIRVADDGFLLIEWDLVKVIVPIFTDSK
jgi:hypothetical protein